MMVIVKLGGSLLSWVDWPSRLIALLQSRPDIRPVLIVGGGRIVEEIREWDQRFSLSEETCHQLALEAMQVTAQLAARLIPGAQLVTTRLAAQTCWSRGQVPILQNLKPHCGELPRCWTVTSDSLAAEVARQWGADELWLLKSAAWPPGMTIQDASRSGLIDTYFPALASAPFDVQWCNLRVAPTVISIKPVPTPPSGTSSA